MDKLFSLVFHGEVAMGKDPEDVRGKIQALLKTDSSEIERLFSGQKIYIKKGLDSATIGRYKQAFEATGAVCAVEPEAPEKSVLRQAPPDKKIICPKCGIEQPDASICMACGIVFAKYQRRLEAEKYGMREAGQGLYGTTCSSSDQTGYATDRGGALAKFFRVALVILVIAAACYFGYWRLSRGNEGNLVFTSNDCGDPCQSAIVHLQLAGVEFTEYNIDASEENLELFRKYRSNILPLAVINEEILVGYRQSRYQNAIDELQGRYLPESADSVVMYTAWGCGQCRQARELFAELDVQYVEHDIAYPDDQRRYQKLNGRGAPLILIDGKRMDGFNRQAIIEALKKADLM